MAERVAAIGNAYRRWIWSHLQLMCLYYGNGVGCHFLHPSPLIVHNAIIITVSFFHHFLHPSPLLVHNAAITTVSFFQVITKWDCLEDRVVHISFNRSNVWIPTKNLNVYVRLQLGREKMKLPSIHVYLFGCIQNELTADIVHILYYCLYSSLSSLVIIVVVTTLRLWYVLLLLLLTLGDWIDK